jgi:CheY-like chemotaxis protein
MGYTVAGMAASGEDAIENARHLSPDLVFMDILMPGKMNGIEAAKIITTELGIPVVFITAYADDTIIEKTKSIRPYRYVIKSFTDLQINTAVEVTLFRKATEVEE